MMEFLFLEKAASILEVKSVRQEFRVGFWMQRAQVLHDISLDVPEKSIFGFLGANGAGKTTLIHLIAGIRKPTAGTVKVCGFEASSLEARARIGYLPERPYFHEHLTAEGVLHYFGALSGLTRPEVDARVEKVLETVGIARARRLELKRFSKGMLQRIGIAQALLHDPEFLVLDEPMSGLDPLGRKEIRELILKLAAEGHTVFFSTHVIPDVEAICNQVAVIDKGKILGCGPIGQFLSQGPLMTEVAFTGIPVAQARRMKEFQDVREIPDGGRGTVSGQEDVKAILKKLLAADATVLWVQPQRPSLEDLFQ